MTPENLIYLTIGVAMIGTMIPEWVGVLSPRATRMPISHNLLSAIGSALIAYSLFAQ